MASYFRWMKQHYRQEEDHMIYGKPRSRSLDARTLELTGVRHPSVVSSRFRKAERSKIAPGTSKKMKISTHCLKKKIKLREIYFRISKKKKNEKLQNVGKNVKKMSRN